MKRAAEGRELLARLHNVGETKVRDLNVQRLVQEEVFRFEIAVDNQKRVAIFDGRNDLQ